MNNMVGFDTIRQAKQSLSRIADQNPNLLGMSSVDDWLAILKGIEKTDMGKTIQVGVRFPGEVVDLIDAFAEATTTELRENQNLPGLEVNRAGAIRILVEQALRDRGYLVKSSDLTGKKGRKK